VTAKYFGQRILRKEDTALLTGTGQYTDDITLPGMLHVAFKRADFAHARNLRIDASEARKRPGVVAIYTAEDFGDYWKAGGLQVPPPFAIKGAQFNERTYLPIAKDKIRFSGEVLAVVVAEDRYIAEDACEDIIVDFETLDAVTDMEKALEPGAPLVHDELGTNLSALVKQERGSFAEAKAKADVVVKRKVWIDRGAAAAIENRAMVIDWDEKTRQMTIWCTTQAPIPLRNSIAARLGLFESQVRVINPFIGGGFGPKILSTLPDDVLLPWIALRLKRPLKWTEDRRENFLATSSERDQVHIAEIAVNRDGKILGFSDIFYHNTGAYNPYGMTVPLNTQTHTTSCYDIPNFYTEIRMVFTNKMVVTPVRGAGRTYGIYIMERMMDVAAKAIGMDPVEIRRRNILPSDKFPFRTGIIGQDFVEGVLDSGNYPLALEKCVDLINYKSWKQEKARLEKETGKKYGIGVICFTEGTSVGPYEGARITVHSNGKATCATGLSTQGQGHFTVYAQIVADQIGVDVKDVNIITGDTGYFHWGAGTFASRGTGVSAVAIHNCALKVRAKIFATAAKFLGVSEDQLELANGKVTVKSDPAKYLTLGDLAVKANPMRGVIEPGVEPGLEATAFFGPPYGATGMGSVGIILAVDPKTYQVNVEKMAFVHDCGRVVNPLLLEGQVMGGIQMGIGNCFYEKLSYDENGQLLNASFMDYTFPQATDMPKETVFGHVETPSPLNPLGVKGVGEAGAIAPPPAFTQALENALADSGVEITESPLSPSLLFEIVKKSLK
jgi:carbon-monoxide dehydrogenase large subunit